MTTTKSPVDLFGRAYANLKSVRQNLGTGYVHERTFYEMYNQALNDLEQTGNDVQNWRIPSSAIGSLDAGELRAKIDAILTYFTVQRESVKIGFQN